MAGLNQSPYIEIILHTGLYIYCTYLGYSIIVVALMRNTHIWLLICGLLFFCFRVGRPFKHGACNWYYENYPPPKIKWRPEKFM